MTFMICILNLKYSPQGICVQFLYTSRSLHVNLNELRHYMLSLIVFPETAPKNLDWFSPLSITIHNISILILRERTNLLKTHPLHVNFVQGHFCMFHMQI